MASQLVAERSFPIDDMGYQVKVFKDTLAFRAEWNCQRCGQSNQELADFVPEAMELAVDAINRHHASNHLPTGTPVVG